ncbi:DMT family transporter [Streptomyces hoynatensis]|uniref:DMT family transporter n=1 Tax=Streptomyces hoynatensis TaxID=1141874 RepID=UPI001F4DEFB4|nr:EamA family transporter [Streptomyces hoynatensis]
MRRRPWAGPLLVLAAAALWGTTGTVANLAPDGTPALSIGAATMGLGGLLTFALTPRSALAVLRGGRAVLPWALLGALSVVVYPLAFYPAMALAGVAVGTVVALGCAPAFAALFARLFGRARLGLRWAAATASATTGCALLALGGHETGEGGGHAAAGVGLGLLAGACYALFAHCAAQVIRHGHPARAAMGALFGLAATVLLPVLVATGGPLLGRPRGQAVALYLAVVPMWLAYVCFGAGLGRIEARTAVTLSLFEPVVAAVLGVTVVGERLGPAGWAGLALVVLGLVALTVRAGATPPPA